MPVPVTKAMLLEVLREITALLEADDSFEGSLEYLVPDPNDPVTTVDGEPVQFMLRAAYRMGNATMGQGSLRMIGELR